MRCFCLKHRVAFIAGKPAPTGSGMYANIVDDTDPCGSGLARDGVTSIEAARPDTP
mgnify:FL=1